MDYALRPCALEMDYKAYVHFLVEHHGELGLPYAFPMKLSFIAAPLMFGKAALVVEQESYEFVGAAGFVYGTGDNDYEDRHLCQLEVLYIRPEFRTAALFPRVLRSVVELMKEGEPTVRTVQYWASPRLPEQRRLYAKLLALPGSASASAENGLTLYQAPYDEIEVYCSRFPKL